jgi:hypothetical protein
MRHVTKQQGKSGDRIYLPKQKTLKPPINFPFHSLLSEIFGLLMDAEGENGG